MLSDSTPGGISILITSAPKSANCRTQVGPARTRERSRMRNRPSAVAAGGFGMARLRLEAHQTGNDVALHLRGARGDGRRAGIAEMPLHVVLHVVAVGAHDLHAHVGGLHVG